MCMEGLCTGRWVHTYVSTGVINAERVGRVGMSSLNSFRVLAFIGGG